jgi:FAD-linked sulfhydryl oxidase
MGRSGECASHFQGHLKKFPPQVSSRNAAAGWACFIHNEVNQMLKKPVYDCNNLGDEYDCGCGDDDENPPSTKKTGSEEDDGQDIGSSSLGEGSHDSNLAVEINKEP